MTVHPHGTFNVDRTWHVGTGQRIGEQSAGLVVLVTVGHGVVVGRDGLLVVLGGRVMILQLMVVCVYDVLVLVLRTVVVLVLVVGLGGGDEEVV